jgi:DNA polymerase-3 subunit delta
MGKQKNITILHGDDEEAIAETVRKLIEKEQAGGFADFNLSNLDGKGLSDEELSNSLYVLPFGGERRTIILKNPLDLAGGRSGNQKFLNLLSSIPETTFLYLVIPDQIERRDWGILSNNHFLRKWVKNNPDVAQIVEKKVPSKGAMREWISRKAMARDGEIEPAAAQMLANLLGTDTHALSQELDKLLLYTDRQRAITTEDITLLVSGSIKVSTFDMVDAVAIGNAEKAIHFLHILLEDQELPALFAMIVRQFRLLIQTREILDEHGGIGMVQDELDQIPFVAEKLTRQASGFTMNKLRLIYAMLAEIDYKFKTSQIDPLTALDAFIVEVSLMAGR